MPRKTSTARRTAIVDGVETQAELTVCVRDRVTGISPEIFADYKSGLFNVKGKVIYGQNTAHLTMISGFGATSTTLPQDRTNTLRCARRPRGSTSLTATAARRA